MADDIDETDRRILALLQKDAALSVDEVSERVNLSRNACWRRIRRMQDAGIIRGRVALVDPARVGLPLTAIVLVRTSSHAADWTRRFAQVLDAMPEVVGAWRMSGDLDYVLRVRIADVPAYDTFYKRLTAQVSVLDISASFVMEELKETTAVPL